METDDNKLVRSPPSKASSPQERAVVVNALADNLLNWPTHFATAFHQMRIPLSPKNKKFGANGFFQKIIQDGGHAMRRLKT